MISIKSKSTNKLTLKEKRKILNLKNEFWKKGLSSQKIWFKKNIKLSDVHNLLFISNKLIGYTCLRLRTLKIKRNFYKYYLFDTLIISRKLRNKGYGTLLNYFNQKVIDTKNISSFLVCNNDAIKFYKKNHWTSLKKKNFKIMDENYGPKFGMIYNLIMKNSKSKLFIWVKK